MADNTTLNTGSGGDVISTDDIAGVKVQRVKLQYGVDGSATDVSDTNPLPIDDAGGSITVDGTVTANLSATDNAVLDSIDSSTSGTNSNTSTMVTLLEDIIVADDAAFAAGTDSGVPFMGYYNATPDSVNSGDVGVLSMTEYRELQVVGSDGAGNPITPQVDDAAFTPGTDLVSVVAGVFTSDAVDSGDAGALAIDGNRNLRTVLPTSSIFRSIDLDETEEEVKGTAGVVYWIHCMNLSDTKQYLKFYNATAASVTVGTTTPVMTFAIPTQGDTNGAGFTLSIPNGITFSTAITVAATEALADNDTTAPGDNEIILNLGYA